MTTHDHLDFNGSLSLATLKGYLSRAATFNGAPGSPDWSEDLRIIRETGALFLGRVAYVWVMPSDDEEHFKKASAFADAAHEMDPRIILQAGIFESIYPEINEISIPSWVFEEFGDEPEERCFRFEATHSRERRTEYAWDFGEGGTCPDITLRESQYWFYYRARRYIDAGYEAIHMGQPHMYADRDHGYRNLAALFERIRTYANRAARRRLVLLDAHSHGIVVDGAQLFDWLSRPLSALNWASRPEAIILQLKGRSLGGRSPLGFECATTPYLYEVDNWGGYSIDPAQWGTPGVREASRRWGWDDVNWFAHQTHEDRARFISYAWLWCRVSDEALYFQPLLRRLLGEAGVAANEDGSPDVRVIHGAGERGASKFPSIWHYRANDRSAAAPDGFSDEGAVRDAFSTEDPAWLAEYHERVRAYGSRLTPEVPGVQRTKPGPVILVGDVQEVFGGRPGDNYDAFSRLYQTGDWIHERAVVLPGEGSWSFVVGVGGTGTDYHRNGGFHRGESYVIEATRPCTIARFRFDVQHRELTVIDGNGDSLLR